MFKLSSKVVLIFVVLTGFGTDRIALGQDEGGNHPGGNLKEQNPPGIVAEVNGQQIPFSAFQEELRKARLNTGHRELSPERTEEVKKEVLDQLIARELVAQEAKKKKIDPAELIKKEIDEKVMIRDDEVKAYYHSHPEEFMKPAGVRLRHLLVRVDPSSSNEGWKTGYEKALALSDRANQGENFEELIRHNSDPEARYFGGDLSIQYKGQMAMTEFESPAFSLREKEVSLPIQTLYGFSLIQVVEKIPQKPYPYSEIDQETLKKKLGRERENKRSEEWIQELRRQADIKLY